MTRHYKIAFVGIGSIATRHITNISTILKRRDYSYTIDVIRRSSSTREIDRSIIEVINYIYTSFADLPRDYDIIFITNPTHLHFETLMKLKNNAKSFFIEKPVFDNYKIEWKNIDFPQEKICYIACPLRYTSVIQYVKNNIDLSKVYSARAISSSYLPEWRPDIDYRETYSASKSQGGGVSIDLIHEWDYLIYLFGFPIKVNNFRGKYSNLEIDSDDLSVYIAQYSDKIIELHLDYFGRKTIRELLLFTPDETISIDILRSEIHFLKQNKKITFNESRNSFQQKEIEHFLQIIENEVPNDNDVYQALKTMQITQLGVK